MLKSFRRWWQVKSGRVETPIDGDVPFWVVSLGFHLVLLVLFAKLLMPVVKVREDVKLLVDPTEQFDIVDLSPEVEYEEDFEEEIGADDESFEIEMAAAEAPTISIESESPLDTDMPIIEDFGDIVGNDDFFDESGEFISTVAVKGAVGHSVRATSGAVSRMTEEILNSLQERSTTVVWLFDQSASLVPQRAEIVKQFETIYEELGVLQREGNEAFTKHDDRPLLTQIWAFGRGVHPMLEKETDDLQAIKKAIKAIPRDDSGIENVFSTVIKAADEYKRERKIVRSTGQRKRNVLFFVVTDEAGDDFARLDEAVSACTKHEIPVYIIGVPAPFGRRTTYVKWVDPDPKYDQAPQFAEVSQGPESLLPERLKLEFTGGNFQDLEMIDSGFGPFALTRLCVETSGLYFAVHPNRRKGRVRRLETKAYSADLRYFFDPDVMRKYRPDYVSRKEYMARISGSPTRSSLVQAAAQSNTGQLQAPSYRFEKLDEATFVRSVSQAQRFAAILEPQLNQIYSILKNGEEQREKEASPRWQAGFDLAYGRIMAAKVRAEAYNSMLAMAKTKLKFQDPKNNTWVLEPADSITTGSQAMKLAAKAKTYLDRVTQQHENTPWAMLAQRELQTPIGWKWTETFTEPPRPRPMNRPNVNNNNNRQPRVPQPRQNAMPRPTRPPPKL